MTVISSNPLLDYKDLEEVFHGLLYYALQQHLNNHYILWSLIPLSGQFVTRTPEL